MKKRPDGRYQQQITIAVNGQKKQKCFYGKTKAEVTRKILEYQGEQERGRTYKQVSEEWWEHHEPELSPTTVCSERASVKRAEAEFLDTPIRQLTTSQITKYINRFSAQKYSHKTVAKQLQVIRQVMAYACMLDEIDHNPANSVILPKNLPKTKRSCPSEEILNAIRQRTDIPDCLFAQIAFYTGMRRGEILALQYSDIDRTAGFITVSKSVCYPSNHPIIKQPKTEAGKRRVILIPQLAELIPTGNPDDYIFGGKAPLTDKQARTMWDNYIARLGYHFTPHQLRHAYATRLYELNIDPKTAQGLLGHSDISTTQNIYTEIRASKLASTADILKEF